MKDTATVSYPAAPNDRDRWIIDRRPPREARDAFRPYAFFVESECGPGGSAEPVATIFLTNRECPWRCVMCDLWRNTLTETVPAGAIPAQIAFALKDLSPAQTVKLYNSGSFFDSAAIPPADYPAIAEAVSSFERVIVESHPALVGDCCLRFRDLLSGELEVAMGLETAHPGVLEKLNKRMTLEKFADSARFLKENSIALRVFILVQPPFMPPEESLDWTRRSLDFAFDCGATAATLIPTRGGNGAMEALSESLSKGSGFVPPRLETVEAAAAYGLGLKRGRVFVDLWDMGNAGDIEEAHSPQCTHCRSARLARLADLNLRQSLSGAVFCESCGGGC